MSKQLSLVLESPGAEWTIQETDIPKPGPGEILVKVISAALNPMDWLIQRLKLGKPLVNEYPAAFGSDSAGVVEELGEGVTYFEKGDKVLHAAAIGFRTAAFQHYAIVPAELAAKVPPNISLDEAASIPLGLATATVGLYTTHKPWGAGLACPWEESGKGACNGKPILITAGSTSCGQFAIQLAKMSGFSPIITTASVHNGDLLKSLGATHVVDRKGNLAVEVAKISNGPFEVIFIAMAEKETQEMSWDILASGGTLVVLGPLAIDEGKYPDKRAVFTFGSLSHEANRGLGISLYGKLTELLADGTLKPNHVEVIPDGLRGIPGALGRLERREVSATKLIAKPQETKNL